jgi:hypothetical protein
LLLIVVVFVVAVVSAWLLVCACHCQCLPLASASHRLPAPIACQRVVCVSAWLQITLIVNVSAAVGLMMSFWWIMPCVLSIPVWIVSDFTTQPERLRREPGSHQRAHNPLAARLHECVQKQDDRCMRRPDTGGHVWNIIQLRFGTVGWPLMEFVADPVFRGHPEQTQYVYVSVCLCVTVSLCHCVTVSVCHCVCVSVCLCV